MKKNFLMLAVIVIALLSFCGMSAVESNGQVEKIVKYVGFDGSKSQKEIFAFLKKNNFKVSSPMKDKKYLNKMWDIEKGCFDMGLKTKIFEHEKERLLENRKSNTYDELVDHEYSTENTKQKKQTIEKIMNSVIYEVNVKNKFSFAGLKINKIYLMFLEEKLTAILYDYDSPIPQIKAKNSIIAELSPPEVSDVKNNVIDCNKYCLRGESFIDYIIIRHFPADSECYIYIRCKD